MLAVGLFAAGVIAAIFALAAALELWTAGRLLRLAEGAGWYAIGGAAGRHRDGEDRRERAHWMTFTSRAAPP